MEVFIGKDLKNLSFGRFFKWNYVKILAKIAWPLEPTHGQLECLGHLSGMGHLRGMARLSGLEHLSALGHLSVPAQFKNSILNHLSSKQKPILLMLQHNLIFHKSNLFRHTYDFAVRWTTILDLQWRATHYLKRLLWSNIRTKLANNYARLIILTIS